MLKLVFHKVGAGHAVHAFTPNGKVIVIDLGCSVDFSPLTWLAKVTKRIDLLIITHPHGDHIDEILLLDKLGFTIGHIWRPKWLTAEEVRNANQADYQAHVERYLKLSSDFDAPVPAGETLFDTPSNVGGAKLNLFVSKECGTSNINNHSGVAAFTYANSTVIVAGDNESASWAELLKQPDFVAAVKAADVFLASHHGRESGYSADVFADGRKPYLFVISDGTVRDTDATASYSQQARGWTVHRHNGPSETGRKVVTTRTDGPVEVKMGFNAPAQPYLSVTVD